MPLKQGRDTQKETPPPESASSLPPVYRGTTQGYDFYLQSITEIQKSVGAIESSIKHLCERNLAHETKLDSTSNAVNDLAKEVHGAKKVVWILGGIGSVLGAVGILILSKILDVVVAYANAQIPKH